MTKLVKAAGQAEHVKQALSAAASAKREAAAEAKKREAAAAAAARMEAAAARREAAAARREAAVATKAATPGRTRAALPGIPAGTRRVLTADELKALAGMPTRPKRTSGR